jgi:hypothetical protein
MASRNRSRTLGHPVYIYSSPSGRSQDGLRLNARHPNGGDVSRPPRVPRRHEPHRDPELRAAVEGAHGLCAPHRPGQAAPERAALSASRQPGMNKISLFLPLSLSLSLSPSPSLSLSFSLSLSLSLTLFLFLSLSPSLSSFLYSPPHSLSLSLSLSLILSLSLSPQSCVFAEFIQKLYMYFGSDTLAAGLSGWSPHS